MKRKLVWKLVVAFLSTFSFSLFFGMRGLESDMFWPVFGVSALLSGLAYFFVGIPSSFFIDRINQKYLIHLHVTVRIFVVVAMYALAGMMATFLMMVVISGGEVLGDGNFLIDAKVLLLIGAIAALWFYLLSIIVTVLFKRLRRHKDD